MQQQEQQLKDKIQGQEIQNTSSPENKKSSGKNKKNQNSAKRDKEEEILQEKQLQDALSAITKLSEQKKEAETQAAELVEEVEILKNELTELRNLNTKLTKLSTDSNPQKKLEFLRQKLQDAEQEIKALSQESLGIQAKIIQADIEIGNIDRDLKNYAASDPIATLILEGEELRRINQSLENQGYIIGTKIDHLGHDELDRINQSLESEENKILLKNQLEQEKKAEKDELLMKFAQVQSNIESNVSAFMTYSEQKAKMQEDSKKFEEIEGEMKKILLSRAKLEESRENDVENQKNLQEEILLREANLKRLQQEINIIDPEIIAKKVGELKEVQDRLHAVNSEFTAKTREIQAFTRKLQELSGQSKEIERDIQRLKLNKKEIEAQIESDLKRQSDVEIKRTEAEKDFKYFNARSEQHKAFEEAIKKSQVSRYLYNKQIQEELIGDGRYAIDILQAYHAMSGPAIDREKIAASFLPKNVHISGLAAEYIKLEGVLDLLNKISEDRKKVSTWMADQTYGPLYCPSFCKNIINTLDKVCANYELTRNKGTWRLSGGTTKTAADDVPSYTFDLFFFNLLPTFFSSLKEFGNLDESQIGTVQALGNFEKSLINIKKRLLALEEVKPEQLNILRNNLHSYVKILAEIADKGYDYVLRQGINDTYIESQIEKCLKTLEKEHKKKQQSINTQTKQKQEVVGQNVEQSKNAKTNFFSFIGFGGKKSNLAQSSIITGNKGISENLSKSAVQNTSGKEEIEIPQGGQKSEANKFYRIEIRDESVSDTESDSNTNNILKELEKKDEKKNPEVQLKVPAEKKAEKRENSKQNDFKSKILSFIGFGGKKSNLTQSSIVTSSQEIEKNHRDNEANPDGLDFVKKEGDQLNDILIESQSNLQIQQELIKDGVENASGQQSPKRKESFEEKVEGRGERRKASHITQK